MGSFNGLRHLGKQPLHPNSSHNRGELMVLFNQAIDLEILRFMLLESVRVMKIIRDLVTLSSGLALARCYLSMFGFLAL